MIRPTLLIFLKQPVPGRVKTRLGKEIGMTAAAQWFRAQSASLIRRLSHDPRWRTLLAVAPDTATRSRVWPRDIERWPQGNGDLGARMARGFRTFAPSPTVIVGADIPGIGRHHIAGAFNALRGCDAVFGPAPDGGYWLVGLRGPQVPEGFMKGVRWSTEHTLSDTRDTLPTKARVACIETLRDVDTANDLLPKL